MGYTLQFLDERHEETGIQLDYDTKDAAIEDAKIEIENEYNDYAFAVLYDDNGGVAWDSRKYHGQ